MSGLFRQAALDKISSPDQLDKIVRVVRPVHGVGVATVLVIVLAGLTWSILSTAPVTVRGQGILLSADGIFVVSSPSEGRIERLLVEPGDAIHKGQTVALLTQPVALDTMMAKKAELDGARDFLLARQASQGRHQGMQEELLETKRQALSEQLEKLKSQHVVLLERRRNLQALLAKGYTTASRLNETATQLADLENRIASANNERIELQVRREVEETQERQEIHEAGLRVQALERELGNMERDYERRRSLQAPVDGTVVEFDADVGDQLGTGQIVMRLLPSHAGGTQPLKAYTFVSNEDGKKIEPGMQAHIMPSTTRLQKDGFIQGTVSSVAKIPSTREGIMRRLKNTAQVDALLKSGAPFEVELELETDPATPSGFKWSSGVGPDISIDVGTIVAADVVVDRHRVISLVLPAVDYVFRWLGIR
ncbi:NHLP bacteriocin system secretion protein [Castellaniella sp.]|uniref:NHLP bacteriocin system secretion protein n=1 Tax=Castellaniella sp. TaxID=1955812 RepID=UPI0035629822